MSYRTVEVVLENGHVRSPASETLPAKSHALLTLLDGAALIPASTCSELAERWMALEMLSPDEANSFADDIERGFRSTI